MIWIMIMYKQTFSIIDMYIVYTWIYIYDLLPVFSTHILILTHASWIE